VIWRSRGGDIRLSTGVVPRRNERSPAQAAAVARRADSGDRIARWYSGNTPNGPGRSGPARWAAARSSAGDSISTVSTLACPAGIAQDA